MFKKKKVLGFQEKMRTKHEVDQDYTHHAVQAGHKGRIIAQLHEEIEKLQKECAAHTQKLIEINAEGMKLPPDPPKDPALAIETKETA